MDSNGLTAIRRLPVEAERVQRAYRVRILTLTYDGTAHVVGVMPVHAANDEDAKQQASEIVEHFGEGRYATQGIYKHLVYDVLRETVTTTTIVLDTKEVKRGK